MNQLDPLLAVVLGALQGITEFLPVSSSGHLALLQRVVGLRPDAPDMLLFDSCVHVATLCAAVLVFRGGIMRFLHRLGVEYRHADGGRPYAWGVVRAAVLAVFVTGVIGLGFEDFFERAFGSPRWIGVGWLLTGLLLTVMRWTPRGHRGWRKISWRDALVIGAAQGLAILPGVSRSGSTICVARLVGIRSRWAAEFSFLIAAVPIAGATAIQLVRIMRTTPLDAEWSWVVLLAGSTASFVTGAVSLTVLLRAVRRGRLHYFSGYCLVLGSLTALGLL